MGQLDSLLEHRLRLAACVLLSDAQAMSFARLKELLEATDGNLGAQLNKLEESGYLRVRKEFVDRKPISWYSLTASGRRALARHLQALEKLISAANVSTGKEK
jgi:DNA-binding PadR family transcriptional regulator